MTAPLKKLAITAAAGEKSTLQAQYHLRVGDQAIPLNESLGKTVTLAFTGKMECIACGRAIKKTFQSGYCFPCVQRLAECDLCYVKPELCHHAAGTCREPQWGLEHCMQPHIVYLANASSLKVGITRKANLPTRWLDQGATQGLAVWGVSSRHLSGLVEDCLRAHVSDRTHWQAMLKQEAESLDLPQQVEGLVEACEEGFKKLTERFGVESIQRLSLAPVAIRYPILEYPKKITSLSFDKTPTITGTLLGIKGQYLLLDTGVINIRKFSGYEVGFTS